MKKNIVKILAVILCSVCFLTYSFYDATNIEDTKTNTIKPNNNMLSMMLETEAGSGKYEMTLTSSWPTEGYVFNSEISKCENGGTLSWNDESKQVVFNGNKTDKCYIYFDIYVKPSVSISDYIKNLYTGTQGENNLYYHDSNLTNGAGDNSYRYAGANPNNYVCFGSTESSCPEDNLYRIIGVFEENNHGVKGQKLVKIIKSKSNETSSWNDTASNNWASATLNTKLNTTFLTSNLAGYENKIETVTYKVSGYSNADVTSKTFYDTEITNATKTVTSKIGLMYASDYGFATTNNYWTINLSAYSSEAKNEDWLYWGTIEWTLSPNPVSLPEGAITVNGGAISVNYYSVEYYYNYRPTFYLVSDIQYVSGSGTSTDPYRVG